VAVRGVLGSVSRSYNVIRGVFWVKECVSLLCKDVLTATEVPRGLLRRSLELPPNSPRDGYGRLILIK